MPVPTAGRSPASTAPCSNTPASVGHCSWPATCRGCKRRCLGDCTTRPEQARCRRVPTSGPTGGVSRVLRALPPPAPAGRAARAQARPTKPAKPAGRSAGRCAGPDSRGSRDADQPRTRRRTTIVSGRTADRRTVRRRVVVGDRLDSEHAPDQGYRHHPAHDEPHRHVQRGTRRHHAPSPVPTAGITATVSPTWMSPPVTTRPKIPSRGITQSPAA